MNRRATPEYLSKIRRWRSGPNGDAPLCISDDEWGSICAGRTPSSLPSAMVVARVEFVRERIYPWHDQVLHDYRVHFKDGTYDCISIAPVMQKPLVGRYWCRSVALGQGDFTTWTET